MKLLERFRSRKFRGRPQSDVAAETARERTELICNARMNVVVGAAATIMQALGMDWNTQVAKLCNFADFETAKENWARATGHALGIIKTLREKDLPSKVEEDLDASRKWLGMTEPRGTIADKVHRLLGDYSVAVEALKGIQQLGVDSWPPPGERKLSPADAMEKSAQIATTALRKMRIA